MTTPRTVDEYLAPLPEEQRAALQKLREQIRAAAPEAEEGISYGVPTYKLQGMLVSFGAAKKHCSLYAVSTAWMERHADEIAGYDTSKGTLRYPANKPLPAALVKKIVKARIAENQAAAEERARKKKERDRTR